MTAALRALPSTGEPPLFPVAKASIELEKSWHHFTEAHQSMLNAPLGDTAELLRRQAFEIEAMKNYERARVKLAEAVARSHGLTMLRVVR